MSSQLLAIERKFFYNDRHFFKANLTITCDEKKQWRRMNFFLLGQRAALHLLVNQ